MSPKRALSTVYYFVGTLLLVLMAVFVATNFTKDARILEQPLLAVSNEPKTEDVQNNDGSKQEDYKTLKYQKPAETKETKAGSDTKKSTDKKPEETKKSTIKVEVLNYTGNKKLGEDIGTTLKAAGFEATVKEEISQTPVNSVIIERNDKKAGTLVYQVLKAGKIVNWLDEKSTFDVTVKIGQDFLP